MGTSDHAIRRISIGALIVPLGCLLICLSYACRARLELGYWPTYDNPDPKRLGWPIHHTIVLLGMVSVAPALVISALAGLWLACRRRLIFGAVIVSLSVLLWFSMVWLGHSPLGDEFCAWFFD